VLVFWLHATTGGAHYFFFALQTLQVPQVQAFFCFEDIFVVVFLAPFLQAPLQFGFEQPHPHDLHIIFSSFWLLPYCRLDWGKDDQQP
jgi:hypothetical protein